MEAPLGAMGFIADIHGNLRALDAVLAELKRREVRNIYAAGDLVFGGHDNEPMLVWQRLQEAGVHCIRGTSDTAVATLQLPDRAWETEHERAQYELFKNTRAVLGELVLARIKRLPETVRIPMVDGREILVVHGSPSDPRQEISHEMDEEELSALLADDPADFVVCGGSHVAFQRDVGEVRIVAVGSVGASPEGPNAHFTTITPRVDGALVEQAWVSY